MVALYDYIMTAPVFKNGEWLLPDDHDRMEKEQDRPGLGGSNFAGFKAKFEREYLGRLLISTVKKISTFLDSKTKLWRPF